MGRIALAILAGLLWSCSLPATMPVTATIFGLALVDVLRHSAPEPGRDSPCP